MSTGGRTQGWIAAGILVLLVVLALFLRTGERAGAGVAGSIGSTKDDGRRALALVLARVGLRPEAWSQVPLALPSGRHGVWRADPRPSEPAGQDEPSSAHLADLGMLAPEHYADFVERGGTLIVEGRGGIEFLRDELGLPGAESLVLEELPSRQPRRIRLSTGEVVLVETTLAFEPLDLDLDARELATFESDEAEDLAFAVVIPFGAGRAIAVADGRPFDNAAIGAHDHALFAVRLAEELPPGGRMLHDEYALGLWGPGGMLAVATRPALALVTLHALLVVLLFTWMRGFPRAFPRDPEPLESFSPLLRARARARLFERAGRVGLLAPALRVAAYERLARLARLAPRAHVRDPLELASTEIERLAAGLGGEQGSRARHLLAPRAVASRRDLETLERELDRLAADVASRGVPRADRRR